MFTGLVDAVGEIVSITPTAKGARLRVRCRYDNYVMGESIAVSGTCLTVVEHGADYFDAEASKETLDKTMLGERRKGERVHLERALQLGDRLGGHLVTGHVDGVGVLAERTPLGDAVRVRFDVPEALAPFFAPKGSVTIDGVSLTVNGASSTHFDVVLVPYTRKETLFDERALGARVNLEVDVLAKYVARLLGRPGVDGVAPGGGDQSASLARALSEAGYMAGQS